MSKFMLIVLMTALTMSSLAACGIDSDVHDAVVAEKEAAQASVAQLKQENTGISTALRRMRADLTEAEATNQDLRAVHDAVVAEKEAAQASVAQLKQENTGISTTLRRMRADLTEAEATNQDLKAVYPPRRFKDRTEIETWLTNDDISERATTLLAGAWLSVALEQQARALEDGYIVSAGYYYVGNNEYVVWVSTVTENLDYFSWDPETDELMVGASIN